VHQALPNLKTYDVAQKQLAATSSLLTDTVTSDTILALHCEANKRHVHAKWANHRYRGARAQKAQRKMGNIWRHLFELIRLQHDETHEGATERPLVLTILKHDAFQQQQHDGRQRAAGPTGETTSMRKKRGAKLSRTSTRKTQTTHLGLVAVCALKAATAPTNQSAESSGWMGTCSSNKEAKDARSPASRGVARRRQLNRPSRAFAQSVETPVSHAARLN
jgi:hypothetical protein